MIPCNFFSLVTSKTVANPNHIVRDFVFFMGSILAVGPARTDHYPPLPKFDFFKKSSRIQYESAHCIFNRANGKFLTFLRSTKMNTSSDNNETPETTGFKLSGGVKIVLGLLFLWGWMEAQLYYEERRTKISADRNKQEQLAPPKITQKPSEANENKEDSPVPNNCVKLGKNTKGENGGWCNSFNPKGLYFAGFNNNLSYVIVKPKPDGSPNYNSWSLTKTARDGFCDSDKYHDCDSLIPNNEWQNKTGNIDICSHPNKPVLICH